MVREGRSAGNVRYYYRGHFGTSRLGPRQRDDRARAARAYRSGVVVRGWIIIVNRSLRRGYTTAAAVCAVTITRGHRSAVVGARDVKKKKKTAKINHLATTTIA